MSAVLIAACGSNPPPATSNPTNAHVSFSLPSDDGSLVTVPLASAHYTVLDFFGPTCEPCAKSLPALYEKRDALAAKGAKLVLVAVLADSESTDDAKHALAKWGVNAPFLVDQGRVSEREAGVRALPSTIVLDSGGEPRWTAPPEATASDVVDAVR